MSIGDGKTIPLDQHGWGRCPADCEFCATERERPPEALLDDPDDEDIDLAFGYRPDDHRKYTPQ